MASEEYKESEMAKIVKRLMDEEGFEFGEAVREAMEQTKNFESKADGGSVGIEVLFGPKVPAAPSQLVEESEIVLGYRGAGGYQGGRGGSRGGSKGGQGPAGGASAGGNYGGNRNPSQTYGGSIFSGGGRGRRTTPTKAITPTKAPTFSTISKIRDLAKVPTQFLSSLFGNPFAKDPTKPQEYELTDSQKAFIENLATQKTGTKPGSLSYQDYDYDFGLKDVFTNPTAASTALTAGRVTYGPKDPVTGAREIGGLTYDFEPGVSKGLDFVNTGGLMGAAYRAGQGLANLMYKDGGRVGFNMGGAQFTSGDNISPGTDKKGNIRNDNPFTGGGGGGDGPKGPPVIINPPPTKDKSTELLTFDKYTGKPMTYADVTTANKFLNFVKTKGGYTMGKDTEADALYDAYRTATGRDTFMQDATVDSVTNMRTTDIDGDTKSFFDQTSTITDNPTGKMTKSLVVDTPTSFTQRFTTPTGIMENDVPQKFGAPQSLSVDPYSNNIIGSKLKDGGRVGLFMGGPALEGQALNIYNSMNAYGFSDQEIANALQGQGLYTPPGSGAEPPTTIQPVGFQGGGDDEDSTYVDRQDYSFNPKNYAPGEKLEINPAALGMSFYEQPTVNEKVTKELGKFTPKELEGVKMSEIGNLKLSDEFSVPKQKNVFEKTIDAFTSMPAKVTSQFTTPTGIQPRGPAELGFMTKEIEGIPGGLTRDQVRAMYDNYGQFFGRPSNFASARVPGKAGELANMAIGAVSGVPFVGPALNALTANRGDKSLRSKYTVDNVGFGNTGMRDEFGLFTGQRNDGFLGILGKPTGPDYTDRMSERLGELDKFFGEKIDGFDINNLDPATLSKMKGINSFYTKQIQAYQQRLATEKLNRELKEKEKAAAIAASEAAARGNYTPGGSHLTRGQSGGGLGLTESQAQSVSQANKDAGYASFGGLKDGGLATMFTRRR